MVNLFYKSLFVGMLFVQPTIIGYQTLINSNEHLVEIIDEVISDEKRIEKVINDYKKIFDKKMKTLEYLWAENIYSGIMNILYEQTIKVNELKSIVGIFVNNVVKEMLQKLAYWHQNW